MISQTCEKFSSPRTNSGAANSGRNSTRPSAAGTSPDPGALNRIEMGVSTLPTHVTDPVARLRTIHAAMRQAKDTPLFTETVMDLTARMSSASSSPLTRYAADLAVQWRIMDYVPTGTNLVISNVPGPPIELFLAGARVVHYYPISIVTHGLALNVTVQSYGGHLEFGVISARDVVERPETLARAFERGLVALERRLPA